IAASFRSPPAAEALRAFWADRYARYAVVVRRAVERGEIRDRVDPRRLLVAATAPLYHELVLLRSSVSVRLADEAARDAALAARAGGFASATPEDAIGAGSPGQTEGSQVVDG